MRNFSKTSILLVILFSIFAFPFSFIYAEVPKLINYQAKLTDTEGNPLDGAYDLTFRIYDAQEAGNLLWEETQTGVILQKGLFSILLGSVIPLDLDFDRPYWLAIKVGDDSEMTPRQQITSSGYAIRADTADKAEKIKASSTDSTAGYLNDTVDNMTLEVDSTTQKLQVKDGSIDATKVSNVFGSWVSRNNNTVYRANSDGFIIAYCGGGGGDSGVHIYTDSNDPPTTRRAWHTGGPHDDGGTVFCPVKKGDYYKVEIGAGHNRAIYWISLGR